MYSKDELSAKSMEELGEIAKSLELNPDDYGKQEDLVYAILDRQAEVEGSKNPIKDNRRKRSTKATAKEQEKSLFPDVTDAEQLLAELENTLKNQPKHRGPKTKKERDLMKQIDALKNISPLRPLRLPPSRLQNFLQNLLQNLLREIRLRLRLQRLRPIRLKNSKTALRIL